MSEKQYVLGTFMDIESAINYVRLTAICDAARQHEINPLLILNVEVKKDLYVILVRRKFIEAECLRGSQQGGVITLFYGS